MMKIGIIWDQPVIFSRLIEDCGHQCEVITPHLLAAPFFRRSYQAIIIPSGFADISYSTVLPALRAVSGRLKKYAENGGTILVFGAGTDRKDAYDWLPVGVSYHFGFSEGSLKKECDHPFTCIAEDCPDITAIDGKLGGEDGETLISCDGAPVLRIYRQKTGKIILSTIHEYPSRKFLEKFCAEGSEALL